jgi:hypothetical protein
MTCVKGIDRMSVCTHSLMTWVDCSFMHNVDSQRLCLRDATGRRTMSSEHNPDERRDYHCHEEQRRESRRHGRSLHCCTTALASCAVTELESSPSLPLTYPGIVPLLCVPAVTKRIRKDA